ncbi:MAG: DUF2207 domain-containing protein [Nocardioides sp.]
MWRALRSVLALAFVLLATAWPALDFSSGGPATSDETSISRYRADFTVSRTGDLHATETLAVDFPNPGKHGIFRFFDRSDPSAPHARRDVSDVTVSVDGHPEPLQISDSSHGRYLVARIGSADHTLRPGVHTYVIDYDVAGVLEPGTTGQPTRFYWNLIPGGWAQRIDKASLVVHLPATAHGPLCAVGVGQTGGCEPRGDGTDTVAVTARSLPPRTPVTVLVGLDIPTPPAGHTVPWAARYDPVLGQRPAVLGVVLGLALLAAVVGLLLSRETAERPPAYPLQYAPPDGIGPAQARYLYTEKVGREAFVASVLYAADHGAVSIERRDHTWTLTKTGAEQWNALDRVTKSLRGLVGDGSFTASRGDTRAGERLRDQLTSVDTRTREWAREEGLVTDSRFGGAGRVLVLGSLLLAGILGFGGAFGMSAVALVPGLLGVTTLSLLDAGARTRRTAAGRDLWSRIGGFRRTLATSSSKERFDFSGRRDLYTAFIPYAVALGCAEEWAGKYRTETGSEPPVPAYFVGGYYGSDPGSYVDSMVHDFSSTVNGAISAYQVSQASSSSGGGGFSGGGGGGGGGGGSW